MQKPFPLLPVWKKVQTRASVSNTQTWFVRFRQVKNYINTVYVHARAVIVNH